MNNQGPISLNEALNRSEYPEYIKDKVKSFVLENYQNYKDKLKCIYNDIKNKIKKIVVLVCKLKSFL